VVGRGFLLEPRDLSYVSTARDLKYLTRGCQKDEKNTSSPGLVALVYPDTDYNGDGHLDYPGLSRSWTEVQGLSLHFEESRLLKGEDAVE